MASKYGFWAHRLQDNKNGQPADVIMAKHDVAVLVDCKVCENNRFPLSRMEENQINAMRKWINCGNGHVAFALKLDNDIRMINYEILMTLKNYHKSLNKNDIIKYTLSFLEWQERFL